MAITVFLPLMLCFCGSLGYEHRRWVVTTARTTCTTYDGVKCWGSGGNGVLGTGSTSTQLSPPTDPIKLGSDFVAVKTSCAWTQCCSLSTAHSVKCWGQWEGAGYSYGNDIDSEDELGDALPAHWSDGGIHDIMVLFSMSCVLKWPGDVYCFGINRYDYFLDLWTKWVGYKEASQAVKQDVGFEVDSLGGGVMTLCVVTNHGRVTCKGANAVSNRDVGGAVESVACGLGHCCALIVGQMSKRLDCWGDPGGEDGLPPVNPGLDVQDVGVGLYSTCIVSTRGEVKCYGRNYHNQLGVWSSSYTTSNTFQISSDFAPYDVAISSGGLAQHFCVYDKWRPLMQCWGRNHVGQLGYGDTFSSSYLGTMPMVAVGALCAPYLTGFHYSGYNGEWVEVQGVTKRNAPVYQRWTRYGLRYLWKYDNQHWGIGPDHNRNGFFMIRNGPNLFDPCEGSTELNSHHHCDYWMYWNGRKWTTTPKGSEQVSCFNVDASASIVNSTFTEEGELGPGFDESGSGDFVVMIAGAAVGALLIAVIVAMVVAMRKKMTAKSTALEMPEAVHVPDVSHLPAVTLSVSVDAVETTMDAEMEKETETEVEAVTAMETDAGC